MLTSFRMGRSLVLAMLVLAASTVLSTVASAQVPAAATPSPRQGVWFNVGLGAGSMGVGCNGCTTARTNGLSGGLAVGGTLSPRVLLGAQTAGWVKSEDGLTANVGALTAVVRFYPTAGRFFLTGGLGYGSVTLSDGWETATETGTSAILGLGYDIRLSNALSLTPFYNGYAVALDGGNVNVGQLGLGLTIH